jgi:uncharacterized protein
LGFRLATGELVVAGPAHPIRVAGTVDDPLPYLMVRGGMEARIGRAAWADMGLWAVDEEAEALGLWSGGSFFSLANA